MNLQPLNYGEEGPPYLVNNNVVTRGFMVGFRPCRNWQVYSLADWYAGHRQVFTSRTKREAVAFARHNGRLK